MIRKKIQNEEKYFYVIPRFYAQNKLSEIDSRIDNFFLVVYFTIDKGRTIQWRYTRNIIQLAKDCGIKFTDRKKNHFFKKLISALEFMESQKLIKVIKGDYHNYNEEFTFKIIKENFINKKDFVLLNEEHFNYIMDLKSSIKKGTLLQVLLYILCPHVLSKEVDNETGEIKESWYQVCSESTHRIAIKLGISDITIKKALSLLSDIEPENGKPLIVRQHKGYVKNGKYHKFPNIYTENSLGWEKRIMVEMEYYNELAKIKSNN